MKQKIMILLASGLVVAGCGEGAKTLFKRGDKPVDAVAQTPTDADLRAKPRPDTPPNRTVPLTVAEASKVSATALAAATKPITRPEQDKGLTVASLGLLDREGFWLRTPLVTTEAKGRVVVEDSGASVNVMLLPSGAGAGSGSQLSIAAMQVLAIPITDLVKVRVFIR